LEPENIAHGQSQAADQSREKELPAVRPPDTVFATAKRSAKIIHGFP
jgi:hypothetical protein